MRRNSKSLCGSNRFLRRQGFIMFETITEKMRCLCLRLCLDSVGKSTSWMTAKWKLNASRVMELCWTKPPSRNSSKNLRTSNHSDKRELQHVRISDERTRSHLRLRLPVRTTDR